jgi:hypothetical protein
MTNIVSMPRISTKVSVLAVSSDPRDRPNAGGSQGVAEPEPNADYPL